MTKLRRVLFGSPFLAVLIVAAALVARLAAPSGFMPVVGASGVSLTICSGYGPMQMAMPGVAHHAPKEGEARSRCAFADLAVPAIGGADPIQIAEALRFIMALGLVASAALVLRTAPRLRPPLRGPPLLR